MKQTETRKPGDAPAWSRAGLTAALAAERTQPKTTPLAVTRPVDAAPVQALPRTERVAIFAIHGVNVQQRYGFQDQVGQGLLSYLGVATQGATWRASVYWPKLASGRVTAASVLPTALRIASDRPDLPTYDVYEGYWSPLTKRKTTVGSMLLWLLQALFVADSSTAYIPCSLRKVRWDLGYAAIGLGFAAALLGVAAAIGAWGWTWFTSILKVAHVSNLSFAGAVGSPIALLQLPWQGYVELGLELVAALLLVLTFLAYISRAKASARGTELQRDATGEHFKDSLAASSRKARAVFWALWLGFVVAAGVLLGFTCWQFGVPTIMLPGVLFLVSMLAIQFARWIGNFAVEDVLGDVQVYTTSDTTADFYAIREEVIATVTDALLRVLRLGGKYERIHILAHSLGASIGMDVLIRVRQLLNEAGLTDADWNRIRSFVTFGSALEKTRFFFSVRKPTINAADDQFENDVYGSLFTKDPNVLAGPPGKGIFWMNLWYFHDIVANAIRSYTSDVDAGKDPATWGTGTKDRRICRNELIPHDRPPWAFVHGDYLGDAKFWSLVGPLVTRSEVVTRDPTQAAADAM